VIESFKNIQEPEKTIISIVSNEVFIELLCKLKNEMSEELFKTVMIQLCENLYDAKRDYIISIALGLRKLEHYKKDQIVFVEFEPYRLRDDLFDINHCLDHGFAEKLNTRTYIKAKVLEDSKYKAIRAHYIGCDINGNEIIQDDYEVEIQRFNNLII
jgi:hypothetical protein